MACISKAQLIKLQKSLRQDAKIGAEFGITRQAVFQLRQKYGIPAVTAQNPKRNREIVAVYKSGKSVVSIAKKFRLAEKTIYRLAGGGKDARETGREQEVIGGGGSNRSVGGRKVIGRWSLVRTGDRWALRLNGVRSGW